ncbi:MAG: class I SAM-dependent methyltransferase [Actinomycetota bacterium]|nr:class I SAM-dependent methyltransferase [Actinomycetota bacterium]
MARIERGRVRRNNNVYCSVCEKSSPSFLAGPGGRPNARCGHCESLERHRLLMLLLRAHPDRIGERVLDVAPQAGIKRWLQTNARYVSTDLLMPGASVRCDLTKACFAGGIFDSIICYHVLEHVPDDASAIAELARVLRPGGIAFVQVPRKDGVPTDEDPSLPPEARAIRFGQHDHVRWYGDDFEERLAGNGLTATVVRPAQALSERALRRLGLERGERIWLCARAGAGPIDAGEWRIRAVPRPAANRGALRRVARKLPAPLRRAARASISRFRRFATARTPR